MNPEIRFDGLKELLRSGARVVLMVRHGERPKIDPDDPTFGDSLPLTPEGDRTALLFGKALAEFAPVAGFAASPLARTRITAEKIAEGMGVPGAEIRLDGRLGNDSYYYKDIPEVLKIFNPPGNFFPASFEYMDAGIQRGFHPLGEATDALERRLDELHGTQLLVAASHDLFIAAFLAARGAYSERSLETWPRFLDAAAIIDETAPDGSTRRSYAMLRSGLSDGIVGKKQD